jgi:diguanylate cyclase (GGDEF)-like protein
VLFPVPANESFRLSTVSDYRVLDSKNDARFDNLVQIAAAHFNMPIAVVSLVDAERQWLKAAVGVAMADTPRQDTFCAHTIMAPDDILVVEDARRDDRFRDKPMVTGAPHIRFYAGAPIIAANGTVLGAVCVLDHVPRRFGADDRAMLARLAGVARSLLDLHRRNELLRERAERDPLTGLLNRRGLEAKLDQRLKAAINGEGCGLLYLDLDHFKQVNDSHGHATGDYLLEEIASRLRDAVRPGDSVARIGGDEFAIVLAHPVDQVIMELVAQKVLWACTVPVKLHGAMIRPSLTVGGALAPRDAIMPGDLLRKADRELYRAKRSGRGRIAIADSGNPVGNDDVARPARALAEAIDHDHLFIEWQPNQDITTGAIVGYEALVRWNHPELGLLAPDRFVPLADACGLAQRLDSWVLMHACEEAALCPDDGYFSVNVSARWFASDAIVPVVRAALAHSGLRPDRLVLEITESSAIANAAKAVECMLALKALGIRLALDDFGTGYSALAYLQTLPIDMIKLDRSFVQGIDADPRARKLAAGIVRLARSLDIAVVAEGVENRAQAEHLAKAGCRLAQGFFWARPARAAWLGNPAATAARPGATAQWSMISQGCA